MVKRTCIGTLSRVSTDGSSGFFEAKDWDIKCPSGEDDVHPQIGLHMSAAAWGPRRQGELRKGQKFEFNTRNGAGGRGEVCEARLVEDHQMMPKLGNGVHKIDAGPFVRMYFEPKGALGKLPPSIDRPRLMIGVPGKPYQFVRIDMFKFGGKPPQHYHLRPVEPAGGKGIGYEVRTNETSVQAALRKFFRVGAFAELLVDTGAIRTARKIKQADLNRARRQIRTVYAAAQSA